MENIAIINQLRPIVLELMTLVIPLLFIAIIVGISILIRAWLNRGKDLSQSAKNFTQILLTGIVTIFMIAAAITAAYNWPTGYAPVDMSPLERLSEEEVARIEYVIPMLEDVEGLSLFTFLNDEGWPYNFSSNSERPDISIWISVYQSDHAIRPPSRQSYTFTRHSDDIQWLIERVDFPSVYWGFLDSERWLKSNVRIGNVTIELSERIPWYDTRNNYSSEFIELLVDMLQDDSLFEDLETNESYE